MIESERVPGTRSDPEFVAVRTPPWEDPFTCRVRFPEGLAGLNDFLSAEWWSARSSELVALGATVERGPDGWLVSTHHGTEVDLPEHTLVIAAPMPELLDRAWRTSGMPDFAEWVNDEVLGQDTAGGAWRYDLTLRDLEIAGEAARRELFVWPGDSATLTINELLSVPHLPDLPDRPDYDSLPESVVPLARELWAQVDAADAIYRLSLVHRAHDATGILRRGTDPAIAGLLSGAAGLELREAAKQWRNGAVGEGWRLTGYADALLWPITPEASGEVGMDFVCDVAMDLLRRAESVPLPPAPDLAEWERLLIELDDLSRGRGSR